MTYGRFDVHLYCLKPVLKQIYQIFLSLAVLTCLAASSFAQETQRQKSDELAEAAVLLWDRRVKDLIQMTDDSVSKLSDQRKAFYLILSAKITWSYDQPEGRLRLQRAADIVFKRLTDSSAAKGEYEIRFATKAINLMFEVDRDYAAELVRRAERHFDDEATGTRSNEEELAEHFAAIGTMVADFNTQLAYDYGTRSLRYGLPGGLPVLAARLNKTDPVLAGRLVGQATVAARGVYSEKSYFLAFNLNRQMSTATGDESFSRISRKAVADLFADLLSGAAQDETERARRCGIAFYAPSVAQWIAEFSPERVLTFERDLRLCLPFLSVTDRQTTSAKADGIPNSVDDLLRSAQEAKSDHLKLWFYREALYKLYQAKQFERMISILDGLDGDEYKKHAPIAWGNWRVRAGHGAAMAAFEAGDLPSASRHVERTPSHLRPFVRERLASTDSIRENQTFLFETLNGMEKDLAGIDVPSHDAAKLYLSLADLYLEAVPAESEKAFAKAVKQINKWDSEQREKPTDDDWAPMSDYVKLNANLLAVDEYNMFISLRNISSPHSRIRITLGLLESSIKEYESANTRLLTLRSAKKNLEH